MLRSILSTVLILGGCAMPVYDPAILNLVRAGQKTAANDAIAESHPTNFLEYTGSLAEYIDNFWKSTSGSSATIGTGTVVFTLSETRGWPAGTPVYITEDGDPEANYMVGTLDSDETSEGVISVTVTGATGSGTFTAWTLRILHSATTVASPPLGVADGGTGGTTPATARAALGIGATRYAAERVNAAPGSPQLRWYVVGPAGTGAFAGHNNEWALWNGSAWSFEAPALGDVALVNADSVSTSWSGVPLSHPLLGYDGSWSVRRPGYSDSLTAESNTTITEAMIQHLSMPARIEKTAGGTPTYTLPNNVSVTSIPREVMVIVDNLASSGNITVNVASAGTIDGAASITVVPGAAKMLILSTAGKWKTL